MKQGQEVQHYAVICVRACVCGCGQNTTGMNLPGCHTLHPFLADLPSNGAMHAAAALAAIQNMIDCFLCFSTVITINGSTSMFIAVTAPLMLMDPLCTDLLNCDHCFVCCCLFADQRTSR